MDDDDAAPHDGRGVAGVQPIGASPAHRRLIKRLLFDGMATEALAGLDAAAARLRAGLKQQEAESNQVTSVLHSAAFKCLAEGDKALRKQAVEAKAQLKVDARCAGEAADTLTAME